MLGLSLGWSWSRSFAAQGTHVVALLGQSNMVGRAPFDGGSIHPAGTSQLGRGGPNDQVLIPADIPLQHVDAGAGQMGLDITFASAWLATRPGASLVLVPAADGGTSLSSGHWQRGGAGFEDTVTRINAVMAAQPDFSFGGFLWHQGESDAGNPDYQTQLDQMIADLRTDITSATSQTPFVLGQLAPSWVAGNADRQAIQDTISETPARVANTSVVPTSGLTVLADGLHFDAPSLRTLGTGYASALAAAAADLGQSLLGPAAPQAVGTIPSQTDILPEENSGIAPPATTGAIPDQTDTVGSGAPAAPLPFGTIPDQIDEVSP